MFFSGLVFGCSSGSGIGLGSSLVGDLTGDDCGDCACVNVFMRCAITELRTGFSGVLLFVLAGICPCARFCWNSALAAAVEAPMSCRASAERCRRRASLVVPPDTAASGLSDLGN